MKENKKTEQKGESMLFSWKNYRWMLVGVAFIVLGFVLMAGGGSESKELFDAERLFAWHRIGLAPILVLAGFGTVGYAIMRKK